MRQYVLPESYTGTGTFTATGDDFHYLTRVLRKRPDDRFDGLDANGTSVMIHLVSVAGDSCLLEVAEKKKPGYPIRSSEAPAITLYQCVPKGQKMDLIVRQATETGVSRIVPVISSRTIVQLKANDAGKKRDRWLRIARQAMQQSGNTDLPDIAAPLPFDDVVTALAKSGGGVGIFYHQDPLADTSLHGILESDPETVSVWIGPEGGFSDDEVERLLNTGFQPVYINTNVLRTETAALYAIASVQTVMLEKHFWNGRK